MNVFEEAYRLLFDHFGPQHWWPAETPVEIVVGAVLTQNTNWRNVEKALANLEKENLLNIESLITIDPEKLAECIRPSGFFNVKAKRLKALFTMLEVEYGGDLQQLFMDELSVVRNKLLSVKGVGEETADSILLYGGNLPVFVVDVYTHRIFSRHNLLDEETNYQAIQQVFMANLPEDARLFNEYHALIVATAKKYCKKNNPLCDFCPLKGIGY